APLVFGATSRRGCVQEACIQGPLLPAFIGRQPHFLIPQRIPHPRHVNRNLVRQINRLELSGPSRVPGAVDRCAYTARLRATRRLLSVPRALSRGPRESALESVPLACQQPAPFL